MFGQVIDKNFGRIWANPAPVLILSCKGEYSDRVCCILNMLKLIGLVCISINVLCIIICKRLQIEGATVAVFVLLGHPLYCENANNGPSPVAF